MRLTVGLSQLRKVITDVNLSDAVQHYAQFIPQAMSLEKFVSFGEYMPCHMQSNNGLKNIVETKGFDVNLLLCVFYISAICGVCRK